MDYQRVILENMQIDGPPGLPDDLIGLDDFTLANLAGALNPCPEEYKNIGYLPIQESDPLPDNKLSSYREVRMVEGQPKWVDELIDAPRPMPDEVNAEMIRRIFEGKTFTVDGYGDIALSGDPETQIYLLWLKDAARDLDAMSVDTPIMHLRGSDKVMHALTPQQMMNVIGQGAMWISAIKVVGWAMIDHTAPFEEGVPYDYNDPSYWD